MFEVISEAADEGIVHVRIEVEGLIETWELPLRGSALASAVAATEAVAGELRARYERAQELERQFGGNGFGEESVDED